MLDQITKVIYSVMCFILYSVCIALFTVLFLLLRVYGRWLVG